MNRNHVFLAVGFAFVVLGVLGTLGCSSGCSMHGGTFNFSGNAMKDGVELPHEATLHLKSPDKLARLTLDFDSAAVVVEGDPSVTGIEADYEVREKTPGDASIVATADGIDVKSAGGNPVLVVSAKIRVPPGTQLNASTSFGSVTISGIRDVASVIAQTDSGSVTLKDLANVPKVTGKSSFGAVSFTKGSGLGEVSLATDSGAVTAEDLADAKTVTLRSSFGGVKAESVNSSESLSLVTDSGGVGVSNVRTGRARLRSSFGGVTASHSTFDHLDAHTASGGVHLKACKYKTKDVGTDFGGVKEDD